MAQAKGIAESARHSGITVWCAKGQHEVSVASRILADLVQRYGCEGCRDAEFYEEIGEQQAGKEIVYEVESAEGESVEVVVTDPTEGEIAILESLSEETNMSRTAKAPAKKDTDESSDEYRQVLLPGHKPKKQKHNDDIEAAAIELGKKKIRATSAGAAMRDARDYLDELMKRAGLSEYVLEDGRVVRIGNYHFDIVEQKTDDRKKAEDKNKTETE